MDAVETDERGYIEMSVSYLRNLRSSASKIRYIRLIRKIRVKMKKK